MASQKESKQVRTDSLFLKLLSRDMKTKAKNKDQPTNNHKRRTEKKTPPKKQKNKK